MINTMKQHATDTWITVFIENEAGSRTKHHYNEETFEFLRTEDVGSEYPYPYGFVPGTLAPDGDAADCFLVTERRFQTGRRIVCRPIALLEQTEGGETDHNVLAVLPGDDLPDLALVRSRIGDFVADFMPGVAERKSVVGEILPVEAAFDYLEACTRAATDG